MFNTDHSCVAFCLKFLSVIIFNMNCLSLQLSHGSNGFSRRSARGRLARHLMTGYDKNTIPKPSNTTVRVEFVMYVLCAEMDSVTGLLKTSAWKQMVRMYMYLASSVKFPFAIAENG